MRDQVLLENPTFTYNEIQKELSKAWKNMSRDEKQIWANAVLDTPLPSMTRKTSYPRRSSSVPNPPKYDLPPLPLLTAPLISLPSVGLPTLSSTSAPESSCCWSSLTYRGKRFLVSALSFGRTSRQLRELSGKLMRRMID
jgi:hypothetical protein